MDIEDLDVSAVLPRANVSLSRGVIPKKRSNFSIRNDSQFVSEKACNNSEVSSNNNECGCDDSGGGKRVKSKQNIPGTQTVYLKTWGCGHNTSDGEYMAGMLSSYGYNLTEDPNEADIMVLNSCTVKTPSEEHFLTMIERSACNGIPVVATGCVPAGDPKHNRLNKISVVGVQQIDRIVEAVEETLNGNVVRYMGMKTKPSLDLPKIRKNSRIEIVPISTGCLNSCTYCKTKHARGKLGSYEISAIIARINDVIKEGVKEIWLSSEDTGAYGRDINTNIVELLCAIVNVLPRDVMLRIGMTNPPYVLEHLDGLVPILNHPNVYCFLHVPVQSGSNHVLGAMKREYTVQEFQYLVDFLKTHVANITIATDIIVAFPNETEDDFQKTIELVQTNRFGVMNTTQFFPRPGTPAAKMKRIDTRISKRRTRELSMLFESFQPYDGWIGKKERIWITEELATDKKSLIGHTKNYTQVIIEWDESLLCSSVIIEVTEIFRYCVKGRVVDRTPVSFEKMELLVPLPSVPITLDPFSGNVLNKIIVKDESRFSNSNNNNNNNNNCNKINFENIAGIGNPGENWMVDCRPSGNRSGGWIAVLCAMLLLLCMLGRMRDESTFK